MSLDSTVQSHSIADIAAALGLEAAGDGTILVTSVAEPASAGPDQLALAMKPEFAATLGEGKARAAMLWEGADWQGMGLEAAILAPRPRHALSGLSAMLDRGNGYGEGIHPSAIIDPTAQLGEGVSVGPLAVIGAYAKIGARSIIGPQVFIGEDATIGEEAVIHSGVRIGARCTIGKRFFAQFNCSIGGDGFSYVTPEVSGVEKARASLGEEGTQVAQQWARIHSLGAVTIGDDCEVGANASIDRGSVRDTRIGNGTKIDSLVMIGHNVVVGDNTLICGCCGIAGSTKIGNNVVLAGQTGVSDNIFIGDNVITGGGTKVLSNIPAGRVMLGYPAMKMETHVETYKGLRRLPRLFREVADLKKAVSKLTGSE
ncbi:MULTISPECIES: UDP-3-O-(3-hydroxymyristoyl)glucosamine N-acyltransferase [Roseobacteraceae]|uniref:UDP-3-O-(3-hydroxymyristoyl)glucosamine N-acyltransferase n=1 Tax=Roseobacteraceae TaxID=2854170 RepID=UPI00080AAC84|nr:MULTISPECIES: UDP-3-O-(3-hydroxymyristoyl)glucosamine N-acyltransferase [Roseobacteraceae]ANT58986.1 UDP-3-O-(3-hydroxymyristoyl)glucosamine N-acyltransferase [Salipiger sp. CCB-MM3]MCA0994706.1 UDP-3-O-(3-hydroxymyristoyl)glucosamine N-acyltransferase [Alloyangia pacifica]NDV99328.1 UDP-3-O-(3-hydroxymyristoyl)glucosamine N-acyltransferase [Salipiger sp. PrR002]NDW55814.1 UDP-3-O-(3-hydroxymyristoyl)glucosamine N-acyltransferase [Salipiger sp. PrR004]